MMPPVLRALWAVIVVLLRTRCSMPLESLALRPQLAVYQRSAPRLPLQPPDRLLWVWRARLWSGWQAARALVQPRTVTAWQHRRFRDHWRRLSQQGKPGRPTMAREFRNLMQDMSRANPTCGSPRIVGELRKLGIDVAKSTVERSHIRPRKPPSPTWKVFLKNHLQDLVALEFVTVPTVTFRVLCVLVILAPARRRIVPGNVTEHPTAEWTVP